MQLPPLPEHAKKPKGRGWRLGCFIAGGLGLAIVAGFAVLLDLPGFMRASGRMMTNAATAPGVRDLSKSICAQAAVTDLDELHRLGERIGPRLGPRQTPSVRFNVACFVRESSTAPTCDDVARVYAHAAGVQPNQVNVVVRIGLMTRDSSHLHCWKIYSADGESR